MKIVAFGDIVGGFRFYGPFSTAVEAAEFGEQLSNINQRWSVHTLEPKPPPCAIADFGRVDTPNSASRYQTDHDEGLVVDTATGQVIWLAEVRVGRGQRPNRNRRAREDTDDEIPF
jgi:hypothetical protein